MDIVRIGRLPRLATLAATAALGFALAAGARHGAPASATAEPAPAVPGGKSSNPRGHDSSHGEGSRLLGDLMQQSPAFDDYRDIMPARDRAAAARSAIEMSALHPGDTGRQREVKARLVHWLETDPRAALLYLKGYPFHQLQFTAPVLRAALEGRDRAEMTSWLGDLGLLPGSFPRMFVLEAIGKGIAREGKEPLLRATLDPSDKHDRSWILLGAIASWPPDRLLEIESLLDPGGDRTHHERLFARLPPGRQLAWLREAMESDRAADPRQASLLLDLLHQAPALPLEERLAWMKTLETARGSRGASGISPGRLVDTDLSNWLNGAREDPAHPLADWQYQLRQGQLTPAEILAEARRALPEIAAGAPDALRRELFHHVAWTDAAGAVELMADLPRTEVEVLMLASAFAAGGAANPKALLDLVTALPPDANSTEKERSKVWVRAANPAIARYGDSYPAWVMALPPGIERDMALSGLAAHFDNEDPAAATAYRAAKTLPPGWRPAAK